MTAKHYMGKAVMVSAVAAIGGFLFGFDTAVINGAVDAIRAHFALSSTATGFAVACALVGSAGGAWFAGGIADRFGRVRVMVIASALFTVSSLGAGCAFSIWDFIAWRVIGGIGVGVASVIAPTYIAEVAPAHLRGRLGSLQQLAIVLGIFTALLVDAFVARTAGSASAPLWFGAAAWRWMFIAGVVPSIAYGVLALQIPESPRFLIARGRSEPARTILHQMLGDTIDLDAKVAEIEKSVLTEHAPSLRDLRGPRFGLLGIVWVGIALSMLQQLVGINVVFYYSTTLWHSIGLSEADALTISVITSVTNIVVTLVAIALVDRIGRRPLLLVGSAGMAICLAMMAWAFSHVGPGPDVRLIAPFGTLALIAANGYVVFFGVSWGPVVWVLLGEMFSNRIRASALAVAAAAQWAANFAVTVSFPAVATSLGLVGAYAIFAAFAAISFVFVSRKIKETRGRELEDMVD